jgi:hypothetical protein
MRVNFAVPATLRVSIEPVTILAFHIRLTTHAPHVHF